MITNEEMEKLRDGVCSGIKEFWPSYYPPLKQVGVMVVRNNPNEIEVHGTIMGHLGTTTSVFTIKKDAVGVLSWSVR